jgi:phosphoribosylamine--glycine ligase
MNILLIGSGGREHALAWKLKQSPRCSKLYCAPGNAGIEAVAECVPLQVEDLDGIVAFVQAKKIDFVVVGPEVPLVLGLADMISALKIPVFGPSKKAAQLEGSKGFMKDLCRKHGIPTAAYERFTDIDRAHNFINKVGAPIVIKADGLAAGKGVVVAMTVEEAIDAATDMLSGNSFGKSGASVVIEEFLDGEEISYFVICDGEQILPLTSAQDHKRVGDGDTGPNTGGMGAYSPARLMTPKLEKEVLETIIKPTVQAMETEGCPFVGVLFAGLMVVDGEAKLLEYNARFGDPECQTLMLRLEGDLVDILYAAATGSLHMAKAQWSPDPAICVVMAANGYPGAYAKGTPINNLEEAAKVENVEIFHAGTALKDKALISAGGRVLGVSATGKTLEEAQRAAYAAIDQIDWPGGFCRRDIGWRALSKDEAA